MSNESPEPTDAPISGTLPPIRLASHGVQGWLGRERVAGNVTDIVVLRPYGNEDRQPPASAINKIAEAIGMATRLKPVAIEAIREARRAFVLPAYDPMKWSLVEVRIAKDGQVWFGLYESGSDHQILLVEFNEAWAPCSVWKKSGRDSSSIGDFGNPIR